MDLRITPTTLEGTVRAPSSKSMGHRLLVAAALGDGPATVVCPDVSEDIDATARCLSALGATVRRVGDGFAVDPLPAPGDGPTSPLLDCGESGSTLRFLLSVAAALGTGARFTGAPRLFERPLAPLDAQLGLHGVAVERVADGVRLDGRLSPGAFALPGDVSSQFVSGLLLAAPLMDGTTTVTVAGPVASEPYIELTTAALGRVGTAVTVRRQGAPEVVRYGVAGGRPPAPAGPLVVEGDWSGASFWLAVGALGNPAAVSGLDPSSLQGDRAVLGALALLGAKVWRGPSMVSVSPDHPRAHTVDIDQTPDLAPPIAAVAALGPAGSRITGTARLRLKESDRVETVRACLAALGAPVELEGDDIVTGGAASFSGGTVDAANDHRIAMMAAVAATRATGPVTILGAQCVAKSYPRFFDDYTALGGRVEEV